MVSLEQLLTQMFIEKVMCYTGGKSSSLKAEKAQQLLQSMEYTLKIGQETAKQMNQLAPCVDSEVLKQYYNLGEVQLNRAFNATKHLHTYLMDTLLPLDVLAYQDTIQKAFPHYIKRYDVSFNAHEVCGDIDYPLAEDSPTLLGAMHSENYLRSLAIENDFCRVFDVETLQSLLQSAQKEKLFNAREDLYNLFDLVYQQALHCGLVEGSSEQLALTLQQKDLLFHKVKMMAPQDVKTMINSVQKHWIELLEKNVLHKPLDAFEQGYFERAQLRYERKLNQWLEQDGPTGDFLVIQSEVGLNYKTHLSGVPMPDEQWRELYQKVLCIDDFEAKWTLIERDINSPEDLADLIRAGIFNNKEKELLRNKLDSTEQLILEQLL